MTASDGCCGISRHPVIFTVLLSFTIFSYFGAQGPYCTGILTTLQREFKFKSSDVGFLLTINDIVGLALVTPLAYVGAKKHRPRILGFSTLIFAAGCFISAIPHFISSSVDESGEDIGNSTGIGNGTMPMTKSQIFLCDAVDTDEDKGRCTAAEEAASGAQYERAIWLFIGQALWGIGGAGFFPLGITYIDDAVPKKSSSMHVAALFMMGSLAPVFGYSVSAYCLSLHSEFYKIDADELGYDDRDPRWIGAWWLGFIIYGCILIVMSIPFFFFPKVWPKNEEKDEELKEQSVPLEREKTSSPSVYRIEDMMPEDGGKSIIGFIKGYFKALGRLFTNLTYMACLLAVCSQLAILAGSFSFMGRYIQTQYYVTPAVTSVILGCVTSPAGFFGNLISGVLVKKLKLTMKGMGIMSMTICGMVFLLTSLNFFVGCGNKDIAGVTLPYPGESEIGLTPPCSADCSCPIGVYTPVCGSDGLTYITPCHAGCSAYEEGSMYDGTGEAPSTNFYSECTCVGLNTTDPFDDDILDSFDEFTAVQESCPLDCSSKLIGFIVIFATTALVNSVIKNPSFILKLRCVDPADRAISMGLGSLLIRVLGFVPAPVYFGAAIQSACLMFQESCGKTGNCLIYDNDRLRNIFFGLILTLKFASTLCYLIATLSLRRDKSGKYHQTQLCASRLREESKGTDV